MRERDVERRLVRSVKNSGGQCLKWSSPGVRGVPDRICLFPGGRLVFVEVKRPGGRVTKLQQRTLDQLRGLGFAALVVDGGDGIEEVLRQAAGQ